MTHKKHSIRLKGLLLIAVLLGLMAADGRAGTPEYKYRIWIKGAVMAEPVSILRSKVPLGGDDPDLNKLCVVASQDAFDRKWYVEIDGTRYKVDDLKNHAVFKIAPFDRRDDLDLYTNRELKKLATELKISPVPDLRCLLLEGIRSRFRTKSRNSARTVLPENKWMKLAQRSIGFNDADGRELISGKQFFNILKNELGITILYNPTNPAITTHVEYYEHQGNKVIEIHPHLNLKPKPLAYATPSELVDKLLERVMSEEELWRPLVAWVENKKGLGMGADIWYQVYNKTRKRMAAFTAFAAQLYLDGMQMILLPGSGDVGLDILVAASEYDDGNKIGAAIILVGHAGDLIKAGKGVAVAFGSTFKAVYVEGSVRAIRRLVELLEFAKVKSVVGTLEFARRLVPALASCENLKGRGLLGRIFCFAEGTQIQTISGPRPIETLRDGDWVISYDESTGNLGLSKVYCPTMSVAEQVVELRIGDGKKTESVTCTPGHMFYALRPKDSGPTWMTAEDLAAGDKLLSGEGRQIKVVSKAVLDGTRRVYNFTSDGDFTYLVGSLGAIAHNTCYYENRKIVAMLMDKKVSEVPANVFVDFCVRAKFSKVGDSHLDKLDPGIVRRAVNKGLISNAGEQYKLFRLLDGLMVDIPGKKNSLVKNPELYNLENALRRVRPDVGLMRKGARHGTGGLH